MHNISREDLYKELSDDQLDDIADWEIWVWGMGNTCLLYQEGFKRLEKEHIVVKGYCDTYSTQGFFYGKPTVSPSQLAQMNNIIVLICVWNESVLQEVKGLLQNLQMKAFWADEYILKRHKNEVLHVYDLLEDEYSKKVYANVILCRIRGSFSQWDETIEASYFSVNDSFRKIEPNEIFVDCGAYTGDTLKQYVENCKGVFKKIVAFEPDPNNFSVLQDQVRSLIHDYDLSEDAIRVYPYAVSDCSQKCFVQRNNPDNGLGSKVAEYGTASEQCETIALDEFIREEYSFLKADIESFEYRLILGGAVGIKKYKPKLAICIYHNAVDLYSIALLLHDIMPEYHLAIRHHSKNLAETVLYAWCE